MGSWVGKVDSMIYLISKIIDHGLSVSSTQVRDSCGMACRNNSQQDLSSVTEQQISLKVIAEEMISGKLRISVDSNATLFQTLSLPLYMVPEEMPLPGQDNTYRLIPHIFPIGSEERQRCGYDVDLRKNGFNFVCRCDPGAALLQSVAHNTKKELNNTQTNTSPSVLHFNGRVPPFGIYPNV